MKKGMYITSIFLINLFCSVFIYGQNNQKSLYPIFVKINRTGDVENPKFEHRYGFVNSQGQIVIEAKYLSVGKFGEGLVSVTNSNRFIGFLDANGKTVIDFKFDDASPFNNGLSKVIQNDQVLIIDKLGSKVNQELGASKIESCKQRPCQFHWQYFDKTSIERSGLYKKCGVNKILIKADSIYEINRGYNADFFKKGLFPIKHKSNRNSLDSNIKKFKYGFMDTLGNIIIEAKYDEVHEFNDGFAWVLFDNKYGLINKNGDWVMKPIYPKVENHSILNFETFNTFFYKYVNGLSLIYIAENDEKIKLAYIDVNGNVIWKE